MARDMLLFILNAQWGGAVTAETFFKEGKTDILLRWEEANAFIGECEMWKGPVEFAKASTSYFVTPFGVTPG